MTERFLGLPSGHGFAMLVGDFLADALGLTAKTGAQPSVFPCQEGAYATAVCDTLNCGSAADFGFCKRTLSKSAMGGERTQA